MFFKLPGWRSWRPWERPWLEVGFPNWALINWMLCCCCYFNFSKWLAKQPHETKVGHTQGWVFPQGLQEMYAVFLESVVMCNAVFHDVLHSKRCYALSWIGIFDGFIQLFLLAYKDCIMPIPWFCGLHGFQEVMQTVECCSWVSGWSSERSKYHWIKYINYICLGLVRLERWQYVLILWWGLF